MKKKIAVLVEKYISAFARRRFKMLNSVQLSKGKQPDKDQAAAAPSGLFAREFTVTEATNRYSF